MEVYYGFVKNKDTDKIMGKKNVVGVAGVIRKDKPRYVALNVSTTEKRFFTQLEQLTRGVKNVTLVKKESPIKPLLAEIRGYFKGEKNPFKHRPSFLRGTPFQKSVWQALGKVGYGKSESYGGIATKIGKPKAARAVGMANNANPISLVVPCHRIIGADGKLVGYGGGGVTVKKKLLELEGWKQR